MELLGILPSLSGYDLIADRKLDPKLERDTFSGGVNLTRRARNLRRINDSVKLYTLTDPKVIWGSRFAIEALKAACGREATCPAKAHPAALEWYSTLHRRLV